jgi:O-antigen/teichoic acid export membrane protein
MVTSMVLARGLGPAGLGVFNAVTATASSVYGLGRLGVDVALHVHLAEAGVPAVQKGRVVVAAALAMTAAALAAFGGVWMGAGWMATTVFGDAELAEWIRLAGLLVVAQFAHQFGYSALAGLQRFDRYARVAIATAVLTLALTVLGVVFLGLAGAVAATIVATILGAAWLVLEVVTGLRASGVELLRTGVGRGMRDILALGVPFYLTGLVLIPVTYALQGLLTRTSGIEEMGYLRVMLSLAALVTFVPSSLIGATVSSLAVMRTDPATGSGAYERHAALNLRLIWLFCLLAVLLIAIGLEWVVRLLFGQEYLLGLPAYRWGLLGAMLLAVEGVVGQVLLAERRVWTLFGLLSGRAVGFALLGYTLVPGEALRGYLAADAISLAVFVAFGIVVVVAHGIGRSDAQRLAALALLTATSAAALLVPWDPMVRSLLTVATLITASLTGYAFVLDDDERTLVRTSLARLRGHSPDEP